MPYYLYLGTLASMTSSIASFYRRNSHLHLRESLIHLISIHPPALFLSQISPVIAFKLHKLSISIQNLELRHLEPM
jgi:hypothetical protein